MTGPAFLRGSAGFLLALSGIVSWSAGATARDGRVRTSLVTNGDIWVGQRVVVAVELLAPGFFSGAPTFDLPNPPELLLMPPEESPTVSSEEIDGTSHTVQRYELSAFARRAGERTIPPFSIRFRFKRNPLDPDSVAATVQTEPVRFTAKLPPGAEGLGNLISARDLNATESWKPDPAGAKPTVGDAFTREIVFSAPDVPAMLFPPSPAEKIDGLGVYPKPPRLLDRNDRGERRGERRDTIVYVCERPGRFTIPSTRLTWWDLDAGQLRTFEFAARPLDVQPAAAPAKSPLRRNVRWAIALVVLIAFTALVWLTPRRFWRRIAAPWRPVHLAPLNPPERHPGPSTRFPS